MLLQSCTERERERERMNQYEQADIAVLKIKRRVELQLDSQIKKNIQRDNKLLAAAGD